MYFSEKENSPYSDLYASHQQGDGTFSVPAKLALSTATDEVGPFISPDQQSLYFASGRSAPGKQGLVDIYRAPRTDDTWTNFGTPVNMGKPINTGGDDFYFTIDQAGNVFTSRANKALDGAQLDIYTLVPKTFKINLIGTVLDAKTMQPIQANVELRVPEKDPMKLQSTPQGRFETKIPETSGFNIAANTPGYISKDEAFKIPVLDKDTTLNIEILLTPVAKKLILAGNVYDKKTEKP
jgi:hypothetical protein